MGSLLSGFLSIILTATVILAPSLLPIVKNSYSQKSPTTLGTSTISQPTVSPTPSTTPTPTSTPTPIPTSNPTPAAAGSSAPDTVSQIISAINAFRQSNGLSMVTTNDQTCSFANIRAAELASSFNHDGFRSRLDSNSLPYPSYSQVTENIAMTENSTDVIPIWINSQGHAENMKRDTPFVCVAINGSYYAYEGWKP